MSLSHEFRYRLPPPDHSPETRRMRLGQMDALSFWIGFFTTLGVGTLCFVNDYPSDIVGKISGSLLVGAVTGAVSNRFLIPR